MNSKADKIFLIIGFGILGAILLLGIIECLS
jgi:hypothetical protein